jgi:hypothetical protein
MSEKIESAQKMKSGMGCGALLGIAAIVFLAYACFGGNSTQRSRPAITRPNGERVDEFLAEVLCEGQIKDQLLAPASAKFGRATRVKNGNTWVITNTVDSQNAFGALIRSEWQCVLDGTVDTIKVTQTR